MRAIVLEHAGPPEVLEIRTVPRPEPRPGWVLIQVKAFGLNHSELFTRQGYSPGVSFPRVLGIECVGVVQAAPGSSLHVGQTVAAVMGGMGRQYDGSYAEYTLVPESFVMPVHTSLAWEILAGACLAWYAGVTGYVAVKGALDIKRMLARLSEKRQEL